MPKGRRVGSCGKLFISEKMGINQQPICAAAFPTRMRRDRRPLKNRVTPFGDIVAITQEAFTSATAGSSTTPQLKRCLAGRWTTKARCVCVLDYKGRGAVRC